MDIRRLARAPLGAATQLPRLMRMLSLDPEKVAREHGSVLRDLQRACSACSAARRCRRDLESEAEPQRILRYCANAETLVWMHGTPGEIAATMSAARA